MEDQQSGPGDLTDEPADEPAGAPAVDGDAAPEDEPSAPAAGSRSGRRLGVPLGLAAAAFVASGAFAGAAVQPYLSDRAEVATKLEIAQTAAAAINTLWNYTPENMDTLPDRAAVYLSGDLGAQYRKFIDAIAEGNKRAQVTDSTEIVGVAVETLTGPDATVLVYTNTSAVSELTKSIPQIKYLSYRLYLKRDQNRWQITRMPTITSLDLTPRV